MNGYINKSVNNLEMDMSKDRDRSAHQALIG